MGRPAYCEVLTALKPAWRLKRREEVADDAGQLFRLDTKDHFVHQNSILFAAWFQTPSTVNPSRSPKVTVNGLPVT